MNIRLQSFTEVFRAHACVDDGENDEDHCNDRECGEGASNGYVETFLRRMVHPDELEEKVGETSEIQDLKKAFVSSVYEACGGCLRTAPTIMTTMPSLLSRRVQYAARSRMMIVTGMAPIVRPNSGSCLSTTMTTN